MDKYGVAFPDGFHNERNINRMHKFPQVITCSSKEQAIETAKDMNEYMYGKAVPF